MTALIGAFAAPNRERDRTVKRLDFFFETAAAAAEAAAAANTLAAFLGPRDSARHADLAVLFGGSILAGGDEFAQLIRNGTAGKYVIVGGEGHTTGALREKMREELGTLPGGNSEAELFCAYLSEKYGLTVDALETKSTNCGNNITNLLSLIAEKGYACRSVLFVQDASMQRRMAATMAKYRPEVRVINHAAYAVRVKAEGTRLVYENEPHGMWSFERYFRLLTGEIPRLTDDGNGYGPNGKGFIAHVDVPEEVKAAYGVLYPLLDDAERKAL